MWAPLHLRVLVAHNLCTMVPVYAKSQKKYLKTQSYMGLPPFIIKFYIYMCVQVNFRVMQI